MPADRVWNYNWEAEIAGIVSKLTKMLVERGISIESIHTGIVRSGASGKQTFNVEADLLVPANLSVEALQKELGTLASEMMLDIALGEKQVTAN